MATSQARALRRAGLQPRTAVVTVPATLTPYDRDVIIASALAAARLDVHKERSSKMRCDSMKKDHVLPGSVPDKRQYHDSAGFITRTQDKMARDASADAVYREAYEVGISHWRETDSNDLVPPTPEQVRAYLGHALRHGCNLGSFVYRHADDVEGLPAPTPARDTVPTVTPTKRPACAIAREIIVAPVRPRSTF